MRFERRHIRVFFESLRHRPELRRRLIVIGASTLIVLAIAVLLVLTWSRGPTKAARQTVPEPRVKGQPPPELTGVYRAAERLEPQLRGEPRFASVVLVPTTAAGGRAPVLMVMGSVRTQGDLDQLRALIEPGAGVGIDWQVTVTEPPPRDPK